jgi:hypothetical protein
VFYSTNQKSSVAIAKPIPRPDRLLSRDKAWPGERASLWKRNIDSEPKNPFVEPFGV